MPSIKSLHETVTKRMVAVQQAVGKQVAQELTGEQRAFVIVYVLCGIGVAVFTWAYWREMGWLLKSLTIVAEIFLLPDVDLIRAACRKRIP